MTDSSKRIRGSGPDCSLKIGVIAGTPIDTGIGVAYFMRDGVEAYGAAIASCPQEQTRLQHLERQELTERVKDAIDKFKQRNIDSVVIYCNSLSSSLDIRFLRNYAEIPIITPLDIYREIAPRYDIFGLIAANGNSIAGIERALLERNGNAEVISFGELRIVKDIEDVLPPLDIIRSHRMAELIHLMERGGAEILILGCTHLVYLYRELSLAVDVSIPILEPSFRMMQMVVRQSGYEATLETART